jgi:thiamine kinase-like enzyme
LELNKKTSYVKHNRTGNKLDQKWLSVYNDLRDFQPNIVEVIRVKKDKIYMEDLTTSYPYLLQNFILDNKDHNLFSNVINNYFKIITSLLIFGDKRKFFHNDLSLANFLVNKNGDLILIDPESFVFLDPINEFEIRYKMLMGLRDLESQIFKRYK